MATFTAIKNSKQSRGALLGVLEYVMQEQKTYWQDVWLVTGHDCLPQFSYAEMLATKQRFNKTEGGSFTTSSSPLQRTIPLLLNRPTPSVWSLLLKNFPALR